MRAFVVAAPAETSSQVPRMHESVLDEGEAEVKTHGMSKSPVWHVWKNMRRRCSYQKHPQWSDYGGRGISVCESWNKSFAAFWKDMGPRPSSKHSIDRIDNSGNYEPGNCRWATSAQQLRNTRRNHIVMLGDKSVIMTDAAYMVGKNPKTVSERLRKGWSDKDALMTPVKPQRLFVDYEGKRMGLVDACKLAGVSRATVATRMDRGLSAIDAIKTKTLTNREACRIAITTRWNNYRKRKKNIQCAIN